MYFVCLFVCVRTQAIFIFRNTTILLISIYAYLLKYLPEFENIFQHNSIKSCFTGSKRYEIYGHFTKNKTLNFYKKHEDKLSRLKSEVDYSYYYLT